MTAATPLEAHLDAALLVRDRFDVLKAAYKDSGQLDYDERIDVLDRLLDATRRWESRVADAINADFGTRSRHETAMAEVYFTVSAIKYIKKHLKSWMKPQSRHVGLVFKPATNKVQHQALGVVGVIAPWNYPFQLSLTPLVTAVAAGNRVLLKPSELTPKTAETITNMLAEVIAPTIVDVVNGGTDVGVAFSRLPFDHLFFTGSTQVGRHVMRAAAENLTPVTLELGGKSPTIIHGDYPLEQAAARVASGKLVNAGQTCIAPDYVLVPRGSDKTFASLFQQSATRYYPSLANNPDYTSIVSDRHYKRLVGLIEDAKDKGATIVEVNPAQEALPTDGRKIAPTLILDATDEMKVMQEEIFGPILPVVTYDSLEDAIAYVNERPRPLALYYFDRSKTRAARVLDETVSGGACVNDTLLHVAQEDMPFGGVGPSGMGSYHGYEGFERFSHKKSVFHQSRINGAALLNPPYTSRLDKLLSFMIGRKR